MTKHSLIALVVFFVFALGILAVVPPPASVLHPEQANAPVLLGTFEGITVCADCPGIDTRLTLTRANEFSAEGTYELSMTYLERDVEPFVSTGLWTTERGTPADPDATVYALDPDMPDQTQRYLKVDDDTIRQLMQDGTEIDAGIPTELQLVPAS